ncbi:MAG: CopG family transcriptional regulator [Solirubrobacterales bacterium]
MPRTQTIVQLNTELVKLLDREAERRGVSRSALIRDVLEAGLAEARSREIDRAIVEGYTRIPPGTPDEWGDLEAAADANTREMLERLDEEDGGW